jgi:hypothetical protein
MDKAFFVLFFFFFFKIEVYASLDVLLKFTELGALIQ